MAAMLKAREMQILDEAIKKLGPDSYLGPWLSEVRAEVERDITSDFLPTATLAAARQQADAIRQQAADDAVKVMQAAERRANEIRQTAEDRLTSAQLVLRSTADHLGRLKGGL